MDSSTARSLMNTLKTFLKPFEEENEVKITLGNGRYDDTTLSVKLEVAELSETGEALSRAVNDFKALAPSYGLSPDDLNKEFRHNGRTFKIVGIKPRSYRYPILVECGGKKYKYPAETVKMYLSKGKPSSLAASKRSKEEILEELRGVECDLSPENLTCDGELSATEVRRRLTELNREKNRLIAELGYTPSNEELYPEIFKGM